MTKYNPRTNAEGYPDPTPYEAERHIRAQITGKQARVAGNYFENMISASCEYYRDRGIAKIEKTPEPMKPLGAKNRKGQFLACYTKQAQPDYGGTLKGGQSIYFEAKHTDDDRIYYPGISGLEGYHTLHTEAKEAGGVFSFELAGTFDPVTFVNNLHWLKLAVSLGAVESLVELPSKMSHAELSPAEQLAAGIKPGLIRMAVGIEDSADLIEDIHQALKQARK